jgi:hypothetical protein
MDHFVCFEVFVFRESRESSKRRGRFKFSGAAQRLFIFFSEFLISLYLLHKSEEFFL